MEVAIHLPDDVVAALPWEDIPRHLLEQIALERDQERWVSEAQVRRLPGYETRMEVHGFLKDPGVSLHYTVEDLERDRVHMSATVSDGGGVRHVTGQLSGMASAGNASTDPIRTSGDPACRPYGAVTVPHPGDGPTVDSLSSRLIGRTPATASPLCGTISTAG